MSGQQTHGYDLAIEFSEEACQDLLTVFFDGNGFLADLLSGIGVPDAIVEAIRSAYRVVVNFDRPPNTPPADPDTIDLRVLLGAGGMGSVGHLRVVVGLDVSSSGSLDVVQIDLQHRLALTEVAFAALPGPVNSQLNQLFHDALRDDVRSIPLMAIPVVPATASPVAIKAGDVHVVDDTSSADRDAIAFLLTFGGGAPGNKAAFTQGFLNSGERGGIGISFPWLCRVISPLIDSALGLGGAFVNCSLTRTVRIDDANEVDLTALSLRLDNGVIRVSATVTKSGFCYDASGGVAADIRLAVAGGNLVVQTHVENPTIDVDIPWYCWVVGAVIGGILAGVLGAVLVPLILYIAEQVIEGTISSVATRLTDALNSIAPSINVPAVGFNLVFSEVFIDDVMIACHVVPIDHANVRSEGTVTLANGEAFDLDSGRSGAPELPGADLAWTGQGFDRALRSVCGAVLARTGVTAFDGITRAKLYGYPYSAPNPISLLELAQWNPLGLGFDPFGFGSGDAYRETDLVFGVRTNEGRYAAVQAVEVEDGLVRLRYRTWEKATPGVEIKGDFGCGLDATVDPATVAFVPSPALRARRIEEADPRVGARGVADMSAGVADAIRSVVPRTILEAQTSRGLALAERRIGRWTGVESSAATGVGRFQAVSQGFAADRTVTWSIDDQILPQGESGLTVNGTPVHCNVAGDQVLISPQTESDFEFLLAVTVEDKQGARADARRCVTYHARCERPARPIPTWVEYQAAYLTSFGVAVVPRPAGHAPAGTPHDEACCGKAE